LEAAVADAGQTSKTQPSHDPAPAVDVALFLVAVILLVEASFARLAGAAPGSVDYRILLVLSGLTLALLGLLLSLRHRSVRRLIRRTPHPIWYGLIMLWSGLSFAALYLAALHMPVPLAQEDELLIAIVELLLLLWLLGWLLDRWRAHG
jgi:hypothetical protein